jgi:hypothetical protein
MKHLLCAVAFTMMLAGPASAACDLNFSTEWASAKKFGLQVNGYLIGANCKNTAAVITITNKKGGVLWTESWPTEVIAHFAGVDSATEDALKTELKAWVLGWKDSAYANTKDLPDWKNGKDAPEAGKNEYINIYLDEGTTREDYLDKRTKSYPMFCFTQGMESAKCLIAKDATQIESFIGVTFPG